MPVYIDVVGRCNLRCPSCPMGNSFDPDSVGGAMPPELLSRILDKAVRELPPIDMVGLYNWTEPLLHPKIGELIRIVKSFGLGCYVSTNLNIAKRLDDVVAAAPDVLRISVSGFTNAVYREHHAGGDIEVVKDNMRRLAELVREHRPAMHVEVYYLRWLGNLDEEALMRRFSEALGFTFVTDWAWMSPLEKVIDLAAGDRSHAAPQDLDTLAALARPFDDTLQALRKHTPIVRCPFFHDALVLDCAGRVSLCCGVYDQALYTVGNYLDHSHDELLKMKAGNAHCRMACRQCLDLGLPAMMMKFPDVEHLATANVLRRYAARLGVSLVS